MFPSINPFTEDLFAETAPLSDTKTQEKLSLSYQVFTDWSRLSVEERAKYVQKLIPILQKEKPRLALLITREMGKPIQQSEAEIEKCARLCLYTAEQAPHILKDQTRLPSAPENSYITCQALGPVLGIMPWNFPFWQVFRFALPALISGNTALIKPAPNVMLCSAELERIFVSAGFPLGVYLNLPVSVTQTEKIITDKRVKGVSLTGSVKAGRAVAGLAGRHLKKTVLELGGSDPYLILDSADLQLSAKECTLSRMNNSGQSCISAKRCIVTKKNAEEFAVLLKKEMAGYKMGDPLLKATNLGPLARKDIRERLHTQTRALIKKGAQVLMGGEPPAFRGYFYPPTVLSVSHSAPAFEEELFGPVILLITVPDEKQALQTANNSPYGLGAVVFSQDLEKAEKWARRGLDAGFCAVNQALHSHPALPFGGIKDSGYGRELSAYGFYEFLNVKTVSLRR